MMYPKPTRRPKRRKPIKSRGMAGRPRTAREKQFHDAVASLGCIACLKDGNHNPVVSIHHIEGRASESSHMKVLPLCAGHHQDGTGIAGLIAVHPWKKRFQKKYGDQYKLLGEVKSMLQEKGMWE